MIVADSSAVIDLLLAPARVPELRARVHGQHDELHGLEHVYLESLTQLRRLERSRNLDAAERIVELQQLRIVLHRTEPLIENIWALRHNFAPADAAFVALAALFECPLATTDRRLATAVRQFLPQIEVIA